MQTPESKNKGDIETPDSEDDSEEEKKLFDTTVPKEQSKMSGNQTFLELFVVFTACNIVPLVSTVLFAN